MALCLGALLFARPVLAINVGLLSNDELFALAREAYKNRDDQALADTAQQLHKQNYVLAPYADYWLMLLRISQADNDTIRQFLNRYVDYPFADRLRGEWLKALAKRKDWPVFFQEYANFQHDDVAVTCYALDGRAQQGDQSALLEGKPLWMVSSEQPDNCGTLFDRMFDQNVLSEDDLWQRFRLALADGKISLAKTIAQRSPRMDASKLRLIDRAYLSPQPLLTKRLAGLNSPYGREINIYAFDRLARTDPQTGLKLWQGLQAQFQAGDRSYVWGRIALYGARRHDPDALDWFDFALKNGSGQRAVLDKEQLAWQARAALREQDWPLLNQIIASMPPAQQNEVAWRYWLGRALKEQKQTPAANALLVPLSRERSYYGVLAEEELGDVISSVPSFYEASDDEVRVIIPLPAIQRTMELQRLDMRWEARSEWVWATRNFDDRQMIAAAQLAANQGWYDLSILTADKTSATHDFSLRYPTPFRSMMDNYARDNGLDEAWVYGLIRQESRFMSYARSGVGASGLMQVMPATARWIAKRLGLGKYDPTTINQLETNIQFGTHYLRYTLDEMGGQALMATAAYNAGPSRAKRWAAAQPLEGAIYAETIPFSETRNYVQKVMANAYFYAFRLGVKAQTLKQRLGVIGVADPGTTPDSSGALNADDTQ